jgi:hypothetical protein
MDTRIRTGYHIVRTVDWSSLSWIWKESVNRSRTDSRPDVLLRRSDGSSWNINFSIQWSVRKKEARRLDGWCWTVWRPDGMTHRPDGWSRQMGVRTGWHIVRTADRELEFSSNLDITLKVESLFTASLHISDFVQTQNNAKILTNSPFGHSGTKITWPVWKYIPGPKIKITPPFCHKGTKDKQSNNNNQLK